MVVLIRLWKRLFRRKKELELLELESLQDTTWSLRTQEDDLVKPAGGVYDFLIDDRLPEKARERAGKVALKEVYHERREAAVHEVYELEDKHQRELGELRERQQRESDQAEGAIERLRERFKMTPA
jgi:hypothetical protein